MYGSMDTRLFNNLFCAVIMRGSLAQLVEQRPEEPCVPSSSLGGATIRHRSTFRSSYDGSMCLISDVELDCCEAASSVKRKSVAGACSEKG